MERTSHEENPYNIKVSTPKYPKADINAYFLDSDQRYFHSDCKCSDGVVLSDVFPDCIVDLRGATPELKRKVSHAYHLAGIDLDSQLSDIEEGQPVRFPPAAYHCPRCGTYIPRPGISGRWIIHEPNNWIHGYHASQILSPVWPAGKMLHAYETAKDKQEFNNSKLGNAYVDKKSQIITLEDLEACENTDLRWEESGSNTAMGIDGMDGYLCGMIKKHASDGKIQIIHMFVIIGLDCWDHLDYFMNKFDVRVAVADYAPNFNETKKFARRFPPQAL